MAGNDTVRPKCDYHCAHRTEENKGGMRVEVYCCWCGKKIQVPITVEQLPMPGHGPYTVAPTIEYDWPKGWGIREATQVKVPYDV